jgi:hypothetical protein
MPNLNSIFHAEIARLARKEIRVETASLKTANGQLRTQNAALKKRMQAVGADLRLLRKAVKAN